MKARKQIFKRAQTLALALTLCAFGPVLATAPDKTPEEWQAIARADLDATRAAIASAHPGYIDRQNRVFLNWYEQGYREAETLIPRVFSYDTMMSAVRYYVTGFRDGHFGYSDNARKKEYLVLTAGWRLDEIGNDYVVVGHNPEWKGVLPPFDAKLLSCDGRTPDTLIAENVAPYVERRKLPAKQMRLAQGLGEPNLAGLELKRCRFEQVNGQPLEFAVTYQVLPSKSLFQMSMRPEQLQLHVEFNRSNSYRFEDGVLWIHAQNFMLAPPEVEKLEAMLTEVSALQGVRQIVFDARGNGGGDSAVGDWIIEAVTGGLEFDKRDLDQLPRLYAQWRVSTVAIESLGKYVEMMSARYGRSSAKVKSVEALRERLRQAQADSQDWVNDKDEPSLTRADIERRGGKLRRFNGTVALVTDGSCASACLDFADAIRRIPGSVHLGQTTGSDTVYLEQGTATLPSGNLLFMPIKVWRNRVRGDSEALVPDIELNVDMNDDTAVRAATLNALSTRERAGLAGHKPSMNARNASAARILYTRNTER